MSALTLFNPARIARTRAPSPPRPCRIVLSEAELLTEIIPDSERALEITAMLDTTVLDTLLVTRKPVVRIGEQSERRRSSKRKRIGIDLELPSGRLPAPRFPLAVLEPRRVATYAINVPAGFGGSLRRQDGSVIPVAALDRRCLLGPLEFLRLELGTFALELRYVRRRELPVSSP